MILLLYSTKILIGPKFGGHTSSFSTKTEKRILDWLVSLHLQEFNSPVVESMLYLSDISLYLHSLHLAFYKTDKIIPNAPKNDDNTDPISPVTQKKPVDKPAEPKGK